MSTSLTKSLRVRLKSGLRDGFRERGWVKKTVVFSVDVPPSGWVEPPLELLVSVEVGAAKYGGATLFASATAWSAQVAEVIKQLPPGCLDELTEREVNSGTAQPALAWVQFEDLVPSWTSVQEENLDAEVARFFEALDGPVREWAAERGTVERLLALQAAPGAREAQQAAMMRNMVILALQAGLVNTARELVAGYELGKGADAERFGWFERELAAQFPAYGSPVLS